MQSPDSAHLFNGIPINPLLRRIKTPRGDGKRASPKGRNLSTPPTEIVTARPTTGETPIKTPRIRLSNTNATSRPILETLATKLNFASRKGSIHQSAENTPTSIGSPYNKSNYISFVHKIGSETCRPKSSHYERIKILSMKESGNQKTPNLSSRDTPSLFKNLKEDEVQDLMGSKGELIKSHRKNSGHSMSYSRIGVSSISFPISATKQQAPYFSNHVLAKGEIQTVHSLFGTPTAGRMTTGGTKSFTQMAMKASIASAANSPRESQVFSSRPTFHGKLLQSKSFKGKLV